MFDSATAVDAETFDAKLVGALNRLDFDGAQKALLGLIDEQVGMKRSWDSPQYKTSRVVQQGILRCVSRSSRLTFFALDTLRDRYFLRDVDGAICETPQDFFARVATGVACGGHTAEEVERSKLLLLRTQADAQELYDALSQLHALFATPILTNIGTSRGLPISCFLSAADDSVLGIFDAYRENAVLAQGGGGIGTYWSDLRGHGSKLSRGGSASGPLPFLKVKDSATHAVHQAGARRGAAAAYLDVSHPDVEDFIDMRRPEGAEERRCQNLNHGLCISDAFMQAVEQRGTWDLIDPATKKVMRTVDAYGLWKRIIATRAMTGEPYLLNIDTVNRMQPEVYKRLGLGVRTSNLCVEVTLPTFADRAKRLLRKAFGRWRVTVERIEQEGRTAICDLGSLNFGRYTEWQGNAKRLAYVMTKGLDNVLDAFIRDAGEGYEKALVSARRGRDIGLGVMGWFDYLQQRGIPFESVEARSHNRMRFKEFGLASDAASRQLAFERGPAPDAVLAAGPLARVVVPLCLALGLNRTGLGQKLMLKVLGEACCYRNVNRQALAPTATIGIIAGASPSIEPPAANVFTQKTLSGSFVVRNPALVALLQNKYARYDTYATWASITDHAGSVQHLEWMSDDDKKVFRTAYELNQRELVAQAAARQPHISQAQSLNFFFTPGASGKLSASYLHDVHFSAWKQGVKSCYYVRSESVLKAASLEGRTRVSHLVDSNAAQECAVCQ